MGDLDITNINVPPSRGADPTNINIPVHGTKFPSGVTGGDFVWAVPQTTDAGAGLTAEILARFIAPYRAFIRKVEYSVYDVTGTTTGDLYNNTQTAAIISAVTLTDGAKGTVTSITTPNVAESDEIQIRLTTAASTGACKGAMFWIYGTQLAGSTTNPV